MQYLTRYLAYYYSTKGLFDTQKFYSSISGDLSHIRKSLRIFKQLNHISNIGKTLDTKNLDWISKLLAVAKETNFAIYLLFDHVAFFKKLKIIPAKAFPNAGKLAGLFWSAALSFSVLADVKKYYASVQEINRIKHIVGKQDYDAVNKAELAKYQASRKFIWDGLDLLIALNAAKLLLTNEGTVALSGVATALLGYQDVWNAAK